MDTIIHRLEASRRELLDLGLRNPLLNHRKRAKQISIIDEKSVEIYRILVKERKSMSFLPQLEKEFLGEQETEEDDFFDNSFDYLMAQPDENSDEEDTSRYTDTKLQTSLLSEKLQTKIISIHNDAKTYIQEQGVNTLYLALGFLHWYDNSSATEPRRAPLILIPVELSRTDVRAKFTVAYSDQEIGENLSLVVKMRADFGVQLPGIDEEEDIDVDVYYQKVIKAIASDPKWLVNPDEMSLGFFSFGKFLMHKDLDVNQWPRGEIINHKVLSSLLGDGFQRTESVITDEEHLDSRLKPDALHQVKDADSSQICAIMNVNAGQNLVLQGPPGTGKSQTITNIIASCIGQGKTVLFVSEKMAALDVVKKNLVEVGLGDAALELHSHKSNKKEVLKQIGNAHRQRKPVAKDAEEDINILTNLRKKLNAYSAAVNEPIGNTKTSFIHALGQAIQLFPHDRPEKMFDFTSMQNWTETDFRSAEMNIVALDRYLLEVGSPDKNPFRICRLKEFLPSDRQEFRSLFQQAVSLTENLEESTAELAAVMGLTSPEKYEDIDVICRAATRAMDAPHLSGLKVDSSKWQVNRDHIAQLIKSGHQLAKTHKLYDPWFIEPAWQYDFIEVRQQFFSKGNKWWRFINREYRQAKVKLQGYLRKELPKNYRTCIKIIDAVIFSQKHQAIFNKLKPLGQEIFGAQWKNEESDWDVLTQLAKWIIALYRDVGEGKVPVGLIQFLSGSPELDKLRTQVGGVMSLLNDHKTCIERVSRYLKLTLPEGVKVNWNFQLKTQITLLRKWESGLDQLEEIVKFNQISEVLKNSGLGFILPQASKWGYSSGSILQYFKYAWFMGLVEKAYQEKPSIRMFERGQHEHFIEEFSRLDKLMFYYNKLTLTLKHWNNIPNLDGGGELQIIKREINKKRKHLPIRKLIDQAGRAVQKIKPIFMMSPMSIALYLPPGALQFDLVIFDEASQVKPVDAFGAIIRGKQTVVVGDSKQLPPTNFFNKLVDTAEEDEDESVGDMESILSLFLAKNINEQMLSWHYRSRHHSLIAVSNHEFYNNELLIFPSPGVHQEASGLKLTHLPNTIYDRGLSRTNQEEARIVAQAVIDHAKRYPNLTLGVVAFSIAQRDVISLHLERLRRENPECEPFFAEDGIETFFIKNLENVQGDERDYVFISIGYGKSAVGKLSMQFGAINRDGGERRLNVLISRAKLAMNVFCNFKASDIDIAKTQQRGVRALQKFLAYAETRQLEQMIPTGREPDSPFEEAVIRALEENGINVDPQVGTAGFFIDIGVKHPVIRGQYVLGIECDGASYHSSRSARDRDRLRQEVLEGLGWKIYRIWSTDWYRNSKKELEKVLAKIRLILDYSAESDPELGEEHPIISRTTSPEIEREDVTKDEANHDSISIPYEKVNLCISTNGLELHEISSATLLKYIVTVVNEESPVHIKCIIQRVLEGAGLGRAGERINLTVTKAIQLGIGHNFISKRGDFYWRPGMKQSKVRNRSQFSGTEKKMDYVCNEEIMMSIYLVVKRSFSILRDEAISLSARELGFYRVTQNNNARIASVIDFLVENKHLKENNYKLSL